MKTGERVSLRGDMGVEDAYADFLVRYPTYSKTYVLDGLRSIEYCRLDEQRQVYLDYTGGLSTASLRCGSMSRSCGPEFSAIRILPTRRRWQ
jgi:hypothetical protein